MKNNTYAHTSDQELLEQFYTTHNDELLGVLLQRYTLLLLGVCVKYLKNAEEAKDSVQQIFVKAITELRNHKVEYVKSWLYAVARNYCLMKLRDKHVFTEELDDAIIADTGIYDMENSMVHDKQLLHLRQALQDLQEHQKTCITLFYFQKKSYTEISKIMGFSMMQVKSHIQNGKRKLKILIEKKQQQHNA